MCWNKSYCKCWCEVLRLHTQTHWHMKGSEVRYLSAMLAGLTLSMMMTCLLQNMDVDRATPRLEPVALATSTSSGPDAVATESERWKTELESCIVSIKSENNKLQTLTSVSSTTPAGSINWPITETSYSISSVASCPHCFRMLMASDNVLPWRRIPSMLSSRSPGFMVPSLERERKQFVPRILRWYQWKLKHSLIFL